MLSCLHPKEIAFEDVGISGMILFWYKANLPLNVLENSLEAKRAQVSLHFHHWIVHTRNPLVDGSQQQQTATPQ